MALFSSRTLFFSSMILELLLESWLTLNSELPACDGRDPSDRDGAVPGLDFCDSPESSPGLGERCDSPEASLFSSEVGPGDLGDLEGLAGVIGAIRLS